MKKKLAIIGTIALLGVGGVTVFSLNNPSWRENTIFATARDKQTAWLKEHKDEIVEWMQLFYPKLQSIQFDWSTLEVIAVSNGVFTTEYDLSVKGTFNEISDTEIYINFTLNKPDDIPSMSNIKLNEPPRKWKGNGYYIYDGLN
jgi:lipoprotein